MWRGAWRWRRYGGILIRSKDVILWTYHNQFSSSSQQSCKGALTIRKATFGVIRRRFVVSREVVPAHCNVVAFELVPVDHLFRALDAI